MSKVSKISKYMFVFLLSVFLITGCNIEKTVDDQSVVNPTKTSTSVKPVETPVVTPTLFSTETSMDVHHPLTDILVHYLNVGQGDAIFVELPNDETLLIDAGTSGVADDIVSYIQTQGYDRLTYVVATHPHADHIGGMVKVIESFSIEQFIMPNKSHTSKTFENMLDTLAEYQVFTVEAKKGLVLIDKDKLCVDLLGPVSVDGSLNNASAIVRISYDQVLFLFMADAEQEAIGHIPCMDVDVLKVGHHGSDTSSPMWFLKKVRPSYAIIMVGLNNPYGHPADSVINDLKAIGTHIYRTDEHGTVLAVSNGKMVFVERLADHVISNVGGE